MSLALVRARHVRTGEDYWIIGWAEGGIAVLVTDANGLMQSLSISVLRLYPEEIAPYVVQESEWWEE